MKHSARDEGRYQRRDGVGKGSLPLFLDIVCGGGGDRPDAITRRLKLFGSPESTKPIIGLNLGAMD
eukprot:759190-Hanusia_phi.AAC.1